MGFEVMCPKWSSKSFLYIYFQTSQLLHAEVQHVTCILLQSQDNCGMSCSSQESNTSQWDSECNSSLQCHGSRSSMAEEEPEFVSQFNDWLSWLRFLWFSSVPPGQSWEGTLKTSSPTHNSHDFTHFLLCYLFSGESVIK